MLLLSIYSGFPHPEFIAVLECPAIWFISSGKSLKISGKFLVLHGNRIMKLLSLIIRTKNRYMKE